MEPGQLWRLGDHRLICGDCTDAAVVERVMGGERTDLFCIDPPYGIDASSMTMGSGQSSKPKEGRLSFNKTWDKERPRCDWWASVSKFICVWGGNYFSDLLPVTNDWLCWYKKNDNLSFSEFELAWTNYGINSRHLSHHWGNEKEYHITQKPVIVIEWSIGKCPDDPQLVADFYCGSGTTIIACENLGRRCRAIEIDPGYVAVSLERWAEHTGKTPELIHHS